MTIYIFQYCFGGLRSFWYGFGKFAQYEEEIFGQWVIGKAQDLYDVGMIESQPISVFVP